MAVSDCRKLPLAARLEMRDCGRDREGQASGLLTSDPEFLTRFLIFGSQFFEPSLNHGDRITRPTNRETYPY